MPPNGYAVAHLPIGESDIDSKRAAKIIALVASRLSIGATVIAGAGDCSPAVRDIASLLSRNQSLDVLSLTFVGRDFKDKRRGSGQHREIIIRNALVKPLATSTTWGDKKTLVLDLYMGDGVPKSPLDLVEAAVATSVDLALSGQWRGLDWAGRESPPGGSMHIKPEFGDVLLDFPSKVFNSRAVELRGKAPLGSAVAILVHGRVYQVVPTDSSRSWRTLQGFSPSSSWTVEVFAYRGDIRGPSTIANIKVLGQQLL